ncbi:MAG: GGDEF domain-containing protein [Fibromonadaceae bacterium]|jgi:diguanylate cyclase (GGDEF)-like protein|nr:GGDEF domain-containing protein [Fibromonadaceae bacterium]
MKKEKDPRINAKTWSIKHYILIVFGFAAINGFHVWILLYFLERRMNETHTMLVINVLMAYTFIIAAFYMVSIAITHNVFWNRPMRTIGEAARKISKGDFTIRIPPSRKDGKKDYIEVMFDDFNTMTEELASAYEKISALATTDELTKLDNRRSFLEHIDLIWKQNHRLNLPITVLMIDVDYFKKYNDSLGHLEGDKALIAIAQCLKNNVKRETDFVARFGGEEFVCILPFLKKDEALEFAKTLVQSVEDMKLPHPISLHSKYVTISVGMASVVPNDNNSYAQLLDEADKALYSAKESGRNRVVILPASKNS